MTARSGCRRLARAAPHSLRLALIDRRERPETRSASGSYLSTFKVCPAGAPNFGSTNKKNVRFEVSTRSRTAAARRRFQLEWLGPQVVYFLSSSLLLCVSTSLSRTCLQQHHHPPPGDIVQGVAMSTTAFMPFRFFAQTSLFCVSPANSSNKHHHHHVPYNPPP